MIINKEQLEKQYSPSSALVVYECDNDYYIESHAIKNGKIMEGKPFSFDGIKSLKQAIESIETKNSVSIKGLVPRNLIYMDANSSNEVIVWWTFARKQKLFFKDLIEGEAEIPSLIWAYKDKELHLFAVKDIYTEILQTELFECPFPNRSGKSSICLGNITQKEEYANIADIIKSYENYFFNSYFTENNEALNAYWKKNIENGDLFDYLIIKPHEDYKLLKDFIDDCN